MIKKNIDEEYRLLKLLKLKKSLENRFLNQEFSLGLNSIKFKIKCILITHKPSVFFMSKTIDIINLIERILNKSFAKFKNNGETFEIKNVNSLYGKQHPHFFEKLFQFNEELEKYNANLIIHGSYSDNTFISYSDIDLVIIGTLSNEIAEIRKAIENYILKIDPLQHHGVFFINANSFKNYWLMDLPFATLKKSLVFSKNKDLELNIDNFFIEKYGSSIWISEFAKRYPDLPITSDSGVFFVKRFLSELMLIPVLMLACNEIFVYKADSFEIAKDYYSSIAWKCIEISSFIRGEWNQGEIHSNYSLLRDSLRVSQIEEHTYFKDVVDLNSFALEDFKKHYEVFIKETNDLLKK